MARLRSQRPDHWKPYPNDKQLRRIYQTARGTAIVKRMRQRIRPMNKATLTGLSRDQRNKLTSCLSIIKANLARIISKELRLE